MRNSSNIEADQAPGLKNCDGCCQKLSFTCTSIRRFPLAPFPPRLATREVDSPNRGELRLPYRQSKVGVVEQVTRNDSKRKLHRVPLPLRFFAKLERPGNPEIQADHARANPVITRNDSLTGQRGQVEDAERSSSDRRPAQVSGESRAVGKSLSPFR